MSKNLTRKGIAFGALIALSSSALAGSPALAIGADSSVTLLPNAGTEYNVLADSNFELTTTFVEKGAGKNLKFYVNDPASKITTVDASSSQYSAIPNGWSTSGTTVTVTFASAVNFKATDKVLFANLGSEVGTDAAALNIVQTITGVATDKLSVTFTATTAGTTETFASASAKLSNTTFTRVSTASSADGWDYAVGDFVYDTRSSSNSTNKTLRLDSTDEEATQTVVVTAWVDENDNNKVDSIESRSASRTVKFVDEADLVTTTTVRPVSVGDSTVVADITTVPVLNGDQLSSSVNISGAVNTVTARFTRPGSTKTITGASTTWSDTTKKWTVTSVNMSDNTSTNTDAATAAAGWNIDQPTLYTSLAISSAQVKSDVVTVTTSTTAHGLQVGDTVVVSGATTTKLFVNGTVVITSVPTTTSFSYKAATAGQTDDATATVPGGSPVIAANLPAVGINHIDAATANNTGRNAVTGVAGSRVLRNFVVAGTYTVQARVYNNDGDALANIGSAVSAIVGASSADSVTLAGVSSANVSAAGAVRVGTTTVNASAEVLDEDGLAVPAGIDATITVGGTLTGAGIFTVNGTKVAANDVLTAKTNAAGKVDVVITNSSALENNAITLTVKVQGNDSNAVSFTWSKAIYSIIDLADANAVVEDGTPVGEPATVRSAAVGGTHTFNLLIQDQWKTALSDATIRVRAASTTRTVFDTFITPVAGKFSVAVADGAASSTATATVSLKFQKLTSGIWSDITENNDATDTAYVNMDGGSAEAAARTVNFVTQTDKITMNANGANFPAASTVAASADLAATVVAKALKAIDLRVTDGTATTYAAANKAVVAGVVANATTGALRAGASVTAAGAGLLFNVGDVWALDSITWISNTGDFAVNVYSASSGDKKVTITSGAATSSSTVAFSGTATDKKVLTLTSPVSVLAGATLSANILLVDGNGNAVDTVAPAATPVAAYIKVSYDGPGLLSGSLPTETDSEGKANVRYLTGVSDAGIATITVKYDQNFDGDFIDATDIVVTKTVLIGSSAVVAANASVAGIKGFVATTVRNASGKAVTVTVNGRVLTPRAPNVAAQLFRFRAKAGKTTVVVKVDGVTVSSRTVMVKK